MQSSNKGKKKKVKALGSKDAIGDLSKPRMSFIPKEALWEAGKALAYGEKYYGANNWKKGIKVTHSLDAAVRHIYQFIDGETLDTKSKCHHLGSAIVNISMALWTSIHKPELDDRWETANEKS